ncbi:MAG: glycosyltransferase [Schleiferiaceae bacterium]
MTISFPIGEFYPSTLGGPANTLYWHTCALKEAGLDCVVTTTTIGIEKGRVVEDQYVEFEGGEVYYGTGRYWSPKNVLKAFVNSRRADVVHMSSMTNPLSVFTFHLLALLGSKTKVIWSPRGELHPDALKYGKWKKMLVIRSVRLFSKRITFHATSKAELKQIQQYFPKSRTIKVPNFILPSARVTISETKKQFLFLGRIHEIKGLENLITAIGLSKTFKESGFTLIIAGKHEERHEAYLNTLKDLVEKLGLSNVIQFIGHVSGVEKEELLAESYMLILPSFSENFGNVVVEALNQGCPVIASKGTPWAILEEEEAGFHVSNSPEALALALDDALGLSRQKYEELKKNARNLVDVSFDVRNNIQKWVEIYRSI